MLMYPWVSKEISWAELTRDPAKFHEVDFGVHNIDQSIKIFPLFFDRGFP